KIDNVASVARSASHSSPKTVTILSFPNGTGKNSAAPIFSRPLGPIVLRFRRRAPDSLGPASARSAAAGREQFNSTGEPDEISFDHLGGAPCARHSQRGDEIVRLLRQGQVLLNGLLQEVARS